MSLSTEKFTFNSHGIRKDIVGIENLIICLYLQRMLTTFSLNSHEINKDLVRVGMRASLPSNCLRDLACRLKCTDRVHRRFFWPRNIH